MSLIDTLAAALVADRKFDAVTRKFFALHCLDTAGCLITAADTEEGRTYAAGSPVYGATLADKVARRASTVRMTEIDDIHLASCVTPSSVVVTAGLTLAVELGVRDTDRLFAALSAGYDAMAWLGTAVDGPVVVHKGVWPTCLFAPIGTAAVAGVLLGLDADQMADALAIALLQSSGALGAGTSRFFMLGLAARTGVTAALAASAGFHGDRSLLDAAWWPQSRGVVIDAKRLQALIAEARPVVGELSFKPVCAAKQTISSIDGFRRLLAQVKPEEITAVRARVPPVYRKMIDHRNATGPDRVGRITSLPYHLAVATWRPDAMMDVARPDLTDDPRIAAFMKLVTIEDDSSLDVHFPQHWPAHVRIEAGAASHEITVVDALGDPGNPLDAAALVAKFRVLAEPTIGATQASDLIRLYSDGLAGPKLDLDAVAQSLGA